MITGMDGRPRLGNRDVVRPGIGGGSQRLDGEKKYRWYRLVADRPLAVHRADGLWCFTVWFDGLRRLPLMVLLVLITRTLALL